MSLDTTESFELLKAVIALAISDGRISGREKGLIKALAGKAGVGGASLDAMIGQASQDTSARQALFDRAMKNPEQAMQLMVAAANVDGHISEEERELLVEVSTILGVSARRFGEIFQTGLAVSKRVARDYNPFDRESPG